MLPWRRIGVALKGGQTEVGPLIARVAARVEAHGLELVLDPEAAAALPGTPPEEAPKLEELPSRCDLLVVLGGDGTVLAAARAIGERDVAILGINLGQLGFLADIARDDLESALASVLSGRYCIQERARLQVTHDRVAGGCERDLVLNDAVITKGSALARLIELEARVDERLIASYRSDGLILSTPTGSTAYNLSAGGPLVDPRLPALILSPICPHTLTQRPLVLPDSLRVEVRLHSREDATLTLDGQIGVPLRCGDRLQVTRSAHPLRFVTLSPHDPFATLRGKLGWGAR
ncbi:MAG: NAD(+)/NADH kinase [Myxococcota bacterium]